MPVTTSTRDDILFIKFEDARLLDESRIEQVDRDVSAALDSHTEGRAVFDFSSVQFMSSSMLGKLVKLHKKCKSFKVKLKLCGVSDEIKEVFKITRLDKLFDFEPDAEAARKAFNKRGIFG